MIDDGKTGFHSTSFGNKFPLSFRRFAVLLALVMLILYFGSILLVSWIWSSSPETLEKVNALSTTSAAAAAIGATILVVVSIYTARQQEIDRTRPILFPHILKDGDAMFLMVVNSGGGHARDIRVITIPALLPSVGGRDLHQHFRWKNPIPFLPAGAEIPIDLFGSSPQDLIKISKDNLLTVEIDYKHGYVDRHYYERFTLNLWLYAYFSVPREDGGREEYGIRLRR